MRDRPVNPHRSQCLHQRPQRSVRDTAVTSLALLIALLAAVLPIAACSDTVEPTPRRWTLAHEGIAAGVLMAATPLADGTPLIVGGQSNAGAAMRWVDGALVDEPVPPGKLLSWASRGADGNVLVVGNGRRALWRDAAGAWTAETLPAGDKLWGCLAFAKDDAWAVGADEPSQDTYAPVLLRRTAGGWSQVALPALPADRKAVQLFKIDANSADDILVVGDGGVALHFDGTQWAVEASGTTENLVTVRRLGAGRFVVVGGTASGFVRIRAADGTWSVLRDTMVGLSGVDVFGDKLWVSGSYGWVEQVDLKTGKGVELDDLLTSDVLHFVQRLPNGDAIAGGGNLQAWPGPMNGTLLRWTK